MTNLITKIGPKQNNPIYSIQQQIQALGFTCSDVNFLPHSNYLGFTIKTTDGDIAIGTTLIKGKLAFTQPHKAIIFIDSHKVVADLKDRLDLRTKADVKAEQIKQDAIVRGQKIHQLLENYAQGKKIDCPPELIELHKNLRGF